MGRNRQGLDGPFSPGYRFMNATRETRRHHRYTPVENTSLPSLPIMLSLGGAVVLATAGLVFLGIHGR